MLETILWNILHAPLQAVPILISDCLRDQAVIARFSDDSICYEQEQLDAVIQNSGITTSRCNSTGVR